MAEDDEITERFHALLPIARRLARRSEHTFRLDRGELTTQAMYGAWIAAQTWDPEGGRALETWGWQKIGQVMVDEHRLDAKRRKPGRDPVYIESLDEMLEVHGTVDVLVAFTEPSFREFEDREMVRQLLTLLDPEDAEVVERTFLHGVSLKDIGAERGVTESRMCQKRNEAIQRLRAALSRDWTTLDLVLA
jgi:RNA polymerase sigma factor (sigma-70 family)